MPRPPVSAAAAAAKQAKKVAAMDPNKQRSIHLILIGIPLMAASSYGLYKRLIKGEEKRRQVGEMTPDGQLRMFNEQEIAEREKESYFTRIFGTESWTSSIRK